MILRDYQSDAVKCAVAALRERGNTLVVAPTGAGKSVLLAAIAEDYAPPPARVIVLQHTETLVQQNADEYQALTGRTDWGIVQGERREWAGRVVFATVQTVVRNLADLPAFDLVVIDEAHRSAAPSYIAVVAALRERNGKAALLGMTATPARGDKASLRKCGLDNLGWTIGEHELIRRGVLVPPRAFAQDVGLAEEYARAGGPSWGDQPEVAALLRRKASKSAVFDEWKRRADGRISLFFSPSIESAEEYAEEWTSRGVEAVALHSKMSASEYEKRIAAFHDGRARVAFNPLLLTEGYNYPPISCVGLLRNASSSGCLKQQIGRGLRRLDAEKYPGHPAKADCLVLDFGASLARFPELFGPPPGEASGRKGKAPTKECKKCGFVCHLAARECPDCGALFPVRLTASHAVLDVALVELDILRSSPYRWHMLNERATIATAMGSFAILVEQNGWHAFAGQEKGAAVHLISGSREMALAAADDWLRRNGDAESAGKAKAWLRKPPSDKQLALIRNLGIVLDGQISRYGAACVITARFVRDRVAAGLKRIGA